MFTTLKGFTLLEILIALFVFSIVSLMMASGLRTVIQASSSTEEKASRLRETQIALILFSREIEQAVNRPILNESGKEAPAFLGDQHRVVFTHTGRANPEGLSLQSSLSRTEYRFHDKGLYRLTWEALDLPPDSKPHAQIILQEVSAVSFQYLDQQNHFQNEWGGDEKREYPLPKAVKITLTFTHWGKLSQLYVIPAQPKHTAASSKS